MTQKSEDSSRRSPAASASFEALFSYGFRPFFLGASLFAAVLMAAWLIWIVTVAAAGWSDWLPVAGSPYAWHAHEMVYGFAAAAIAGFLLTAVPNWTGALPLSGSPLAVLFATWLAGRAAMAVSSWLPYGVAAVVDIAFLPLLGSIAAHQLLARPAARNLVFLVILAVLTVGNVLYHLALLGRVGMAPMEPVRAGVIVVALMITIIGGRIIPSFTHNWLHLNAVRGPMPRRIAWLDMASVGSVAVLAALFAAGAPAPAHGAAAAAAALLNGARLAQWRGLATGSEPIVWVLHLGYFWVVVGLALAAAAALTSAVPFTLAFHALGTGAAGTMILAVMSRASLGHTGRPLKAPRAIVWAYMLVSLSALLRVAGPLTLPGAAPMFQFAAGLAWIGAFGLFTLVYAPILTTPRVHMRTERG